MADTHRLHFHADIRFLLCSGSWTHEHKQGSLRHSPQRILRLYSAALRQPGTWHLEADIAFGGLFGQAILSAFYCFKSASFV